MKTKHWSVHETDTTTTKKFPLAVEFHRFHTKHNISLWLCSFIHTYWPTGTFLSVSLNGSGSRMCKQKKDVVSSLKKKKQPVELLSEQETLHIRLENAY